MREEERKKIGLTIANISTSMVPFTLLDVEIDRAYKG